MRTIYAKLIVLVAIGVFSISANALIAYDTPSGTAGMPVGVPGLQNTGPYNLGLEFTANQTILVNYLGAFDAGLDGFGAQTITVGIYDVASPSSPIVSTVFTGSTPGSAGAFASGSAFRFLPISDTYLAAGQTYMIVASGLGSIANPNYNSRGYPTAVTLNDGGGMITFGGNYFGYGGTPAFPSMLDAGPVGRYAAGSFSFAVPEARDFALAGVGFLVVVYLGRNYFLRGRLA